MIKALLIVGSSVAYGQCYSYNNMDGTVNASMCVAANNCTVSTASCGRKTAAQNGTACDTSLMTCATAQCGVGTVVSDAKTCSKCTDTCKDFKDNATCTDAVSGQCAWSRSYCVDAPTPQPAGPCMGSATTCTNEAGCMWVSYSENFCGVARTSMGMPGMCVSCNSTGIKDVRSALKNLQGQTCKWAKGAGYAFDYSLTIGSVATSATMCDITPANKANDEGALTTAAQKGTFSGAVVFDTGATVTCAKASSGSAVIPSLAVSGLIVAAMFA